MNPAPQEKPELNRRGEWILLAAALLISFACVFSATGIALLFQAESLSANMLANSKADYRGDTDTNLRFAQLNPEILAEATSDEAGLLATVVNGGLPAGQGTPIAQIPAPSTPTIDSGPPNTAEPVPTTDVNATSESSATATSTPVTNVSAPQPSTPTPAATSSTDATSTATATTVSASTPTPSPSPTVASPTATSVNTPVPTMTPSHTPSPIVATPTDTPTPIPGANTPTNTPVPPTPTNTPVPPTSTNTPVPPTSTNTPVPPTSTNTPVPSTSTNTPVPPTSTNTPVPPTSTNTPVPPTSTNTPVPPTSTNTPVPPTPTNTPVGPTATPTCTGSNPGGQPNVGKPDSLYAGVECGSYLVVDLGVSNPISVSGTAEAAYDLVYYERLATLGGLNGIALDWVAVEIGPSSTGPWYEVFNWGDYLPDNNTNIAIYTGATELDNLFIVETDLWGDPIPGWYTGIAIDVDALGIPAGQYQFVRIYSPNAGTDPAEVDALEVLP